LSRTPAFTAIAILTLAIGIATTTTFFAIVDELAFKPARGTGDESVFHLIAASGGAVQIPDYELLDANLPPGLSAIAAYDTGGGGLVQVPGRAERVIGWRVSGRYAEVHRVRAQAGRWIDGDDNAGGERDPAFVVRGVTVPIVRGTLGADVAVISDRLWREWFDAAPDVVDRGTITIERTPRRIVGVAPPGFEPAIDVWVPFGRRRLLTREELERTRSRTLPWLRVARPAAEPRQPGLQVLARVADGASIGQLQERLTAAVSVRPASVESPRGAMRLIPRRGNDRLVSTGLTILGFAALVFVAACANVGNMLFARAMEREGELATRLALGATPRSIFILLFAEATVICAAAAAAGMLLAAGALRLFVDAVPAFQVASWRTVRLDLGLDWRVFVGAAAAGAIAALVVGAGSLWRSSRVSLLARLTAAGPAVVARTEGRTLRTMLVAVQVTAAVLLLIATGMLLENTSKQLDRRILFDLDPIVAARIELPEEYDEARGAHFFDGLLERVRAIDSVSAAGLADAIPGGETPAPRFGASSIVAAPLPGAPSGPPRRLDGRWIYVSSGLLGALGVAVIEGRDVDGGDGAGTNPVALVSQSTAQRLWPGERVIGKRLKCCGATDLRTVVGVVADPVGSRGTARAMDVGAAIQAFSGSDVGTYVFLPASQHYSRHMLVVARSSAPDAVVQALRGAVATIDPAVPVFTAGRAQATQFPRAAAERAVRTLAGALGAIALCIAMFGVVAVVSYFVSRRIREIGLRLALGATRAQIVRLVIDHSIHMVLIGLLPGVLFASLGTRYFQVELTKLRPNGLTVWVLVPLLMLAVAVVAAVIPARRAARVDPNRALKEL
jgi:predicted permease